MRCHESRACRSVIVLTRLTLRRCIGLSRFFQVEIRLQLHPESLGIAEALRQAYCRICADAALALDDFVDPSRRNADVSRKRVLAQAHRLEEFLEQDLAGMDVAQLTHITVSVI